MTKVSEVVASCGGAAPVANHVERSFDVVVVGDPPMREPVRAEITSWLRHRGYAADQIGQTPLPAEGIAKLTQCLTEAVTGDTFGCLEGSGHRTGARHLVIAQVTRHPDTRAVDLVLAWLGDGAATFAPILVEPRARRRCGRRCSRRNSSTRRICWRWVAAPEARSSDPAGRIVEANAAVVGSPRS